MKKSILILSLLLLVGGLITHYFMNQYVTSKYKQTDPVELFLSQERVVNFKETRQKQTESDHQLLVGKEILLFLIGITITKYFLVSKSFQMKSA